MFDFSYDEGAIIRELGIEASDEQFRTHVLNRVRQLLEDRMGIRIEMELTEDQLLEFNKLGDDAAKAKSFLEARFPNHQAMYAEELGIIVEQLKQGLANTTS